jgi:hypothetical protein
MASLRVCNGEACFIGILKDKIAEYATTMPTPIRGQ